MQPGPIQLACRGQGSVYLAGIGARPRPRAWYAQHHTNGRPAMNKDYEDIPGTFVFDADRSREGYHLNQFCISLRLQKNRDAFNADQEGYLDAYPMTPDQRDAVLKRDWNRLLELGGNIYYTSKLAANDGINF